MIRPDGSAVCDRCGADAGNGSIADCSTAQDANLDEGLVFVYHFGRACGCAAVVLDQATLAARLAGDHPVGTATKPQEGTDV